MQILVTPSIVIHVHTQHLMIFLETNSLLETPQVTDLLNTARDASALPPHSLTPTPARLKECCTLADRGFQAAWDWLETVMECTEAQLRFGLSLSAATDSTHPSHPLHEVHTHSKSTKDRRSREDATILKAWENKRRRWVEN